MWVLDTALFKTFDRFSPEDFVKYLKINWDLFYSICPILVNVSHAFEWWLYFVAVGASVVVPPPHHNGGSKDGRQ